MKRIYLLPLLLALLLTPALVAPVAADTIQANVGVVVNNWPILDLTYLDTATGTVYVAADTLANAMDGVYTDNKTSVTIAGSDRSISVDVATGKAVRVGDKALVPLRAVVEGLGGKVTWRDADQVAVATITPLFQSKTYTVSLPGDYFKPYALSVNVGDTVQFVNSDTDTHTVVSTPDAPAAIELTTEGGKSASFTFSKPGIYHYYCTLHALMDSNSNMVKAIKTADQFPGAMDGFIFVTGKDMNLPSTATVTMPGDYFAPVALMVKAGAVVSFVNKDTDLHTVVTVPGAPADVELATKGGETATFTFTKPGLYFYYCTMHALYDDKSGLVKSVPGTDVYPAPMQGLIMVVG